MQDDKPVIKRLGGYLILMITVILLFAAWQSIQEPESVSIGDTAVSAATPADTAISSDTAVADLPILTSQKPTILKDNSLAPLPYPHTYQGKLPEHTFQTYVVKRGDTPVGIAEKFGISTETILGGNPQLSEEASLLQTGVELTILPIDGVLHDVQPGDTLESLSAQYGISVAEIIAHQPNHLEFPYRLYPESQILIPGAVRELFVWNPPDLASVIGSREGSGIVPLVVGTGSFIFPSNSRNFTQYYWYGHPGVDVGLAEGSAVAAADTGTVTYAGWNIYGYGNLIVVNHGNGYETFYAHLSGFNVGPGQIVSKGQIIGRSGNSGNSSGPHLHFEIRINGNRDDPCWYVGCG
ncbi:MAG: peptidoglycan DD-metalloendopeptidase family protein [Chloroflexi bacterium]|nr:peptidoglycan DD-metalloendopeptidase family protein [Chloroflexota bacterium]